MIGQIDIKRRWLIGALAVATLYSALALRLAFRLPNLVQDDARQHIFWMRRFIDPTLFPNDLIADYFQAVAPAGYKFIYWIFARLSVDPLLLSKLLPAMIGIVTAYLAFKLFVQLTANARGAFFASVLLGQLIWLKDDVISATPRAFVCPLFLAFFLFLRQRRRWLCLVMLAGEGLVYPQAAFVSIGILALRLMQWKDRPAPRLQSSRLDQSAGSPSSFNPSRQSEGSISIEGAARVGRVRRHLQFSRDRRDYVLLLAGLLVSAAVIFPFSSSVSRYGPVISREEALALPEFQRHGRSEFFVGGLNFWSDAPRSGLLPNAVPQHIFVLAVVALALWLLRRSKFSLAPLGQVALAATGMWGAAHLFLFRLHLPARYSQWAFQILFALAAAMAIATIWDASEKWRDRLRQKDRRAAARAISMALLLGGSLILIYPHLKRKFPNPSYIPARPMALYDFLRTQPKDSVIVALRKPGNLIPVFAQRSILVGSEYAIPYHQGFYQSIRRRGQETVQALYTSRAAELRAFIEKNDVDLIVINRDDAATPRYLKKLRWFREVAPVREISERVENGMRPALIDYVEPCKIWENQTNIVLDAHRIAQSISANEPSPSP